MNPIQIAHVRRGAIRWHLIAAINISRPEGIYTSALLPIIQSVYPDASDLELRRELDYLEERRLVKIERDPLERWMVELTRHGIDMAEYTIDCDAGITRPRITQG